MLVPAITKKQELIDKFSKEIYSEKYFYYIGSAHNNLLPEIEIKNNEYQYAIVDEEAEAVVGYFAYRVSPSNNAVFNFGLYSFDDKKGFLLYKDVTNKIKELISTYHRIEWLAIGGNKIKKFYDRFCLSFGGKIIELQDVVRDSKRNYHNSYIYEIINEEEDFR